MDELKTTGFMDQFPDAMSMAAGLNRALEQVRFKVEHGAICVGMEYHRSYMEMRFTTLERLHIVFWKYGFFGSLVEQ